MGGRRLGVSAQVWWKCHLVGGGGGGWGRSNRKLSPKSDMLKIFKKIWLQYFGYITCRSYFQIRPIIGDGGKKMEVLVGPRRSNRKMSPKKEDTLWLRMSSTTLYLTKTKYFFLNTYKLTLKKTTFLSFFLLRKTNFTPLPTHPTASKKLWRSAP